MVPLRGKYAGSFFLGGKLGHYNKEEAHYEKVYGEIRF